MASQIYEIKQNGKWSKVRATCMQALNNWAKDNSVSDWRMAGMMSRSEIAACNSLIVVA